MLLWPTNQHLLLSYYFSSSCSRSQPYLPHLSQHNVSQIYLSFKVDKHHGCSCPHLGGSTSTNGKSNIGKSSSLHNKHQSYNKTFMQTTHTEVATMQMFVLW